LFPKASRNANGNSSPSNGRPPSAESASSISTAFMVRTVTPRLLQSTIISLRGARAIPVSRSDEGAALARTASSDLRRSAPGVKSDLVKQRSVVGGQHAAHFLMDGRGAASGHRARGGERDRRATMWTRRDVGLCASGGGSPRAQPLRFDAFEPSPTRGAFRRSRHSPSPRVCPEHTCSSSAKE
jgi:hypothetical protein